MLLLLLLLAQFGFGNAACSFYAAGGTGLLSSSPRGVALDGSGRVFVADETSNSVVVFDKTNAPTGISFGNATLSQPQGVAVDSAKVYVASMGSNAVVRFAVAGGAVDAIFTGLSAPIGIALDALGTTLFVADSGNNRVKYFDTVLNSSATFGTGLMAAPRGVAVGALGSVYVADTGNNRVQLWTKLVSYSLASTSSASLALSAPTDLAVVGSTLVLSTLYVVDAGNSRIVVLDGNLNLVSAFGAGTGTSGFRVQGVGQFQNPFGITVDSGLSVRVTDSGRFQEFLCGPPISQTVSFSSTAPLLATAGGSQLYTPVATASSGLPVAVTVDPSSSAVCAIAGGLVSSIGAGQCLLLANQAGNAKYSAAAQAIQAFTVAQGTQNVSFNSAAPSSASVGGAAYQVLASATSLLPVTFSIDVNTSTNCAITATGLVTFLRAGQCTINAIQLGNLNLLPSALVQQTLTIAKAAQSLSFVQNITTAQVGGPTYTPQVVSTLGLAAIITVSNGGCIMISGVVSFVAATPCTLTASQGGNADVLAAVSMQVITVSKGVQALMFTSTPPAAAGIGNMYTPVVVGTLPNISITIDASAASVCSASNGVVTITGTGGLCVVVATQTGNADWLTAQVMQSFGVGSGLLGQSLTWVSPMPPMPRVGDQYVLSASSSAGLPVTFSLAPTSSGVCSLSGSTVTLLTTGSCVVLGNQLGNATIGIATQIQRAISVLPGLQTIFLNSTAPVGARVGDAPYHVVATATSLLPVTVSAAPPAVCIADGSGVVSFVGSGTCNVTGQQNGNASFLAAVDVVQSFFVALGQQILSFASAAPVNAQVGGAGYAPMAMSDKGLSVTFLINASSASVCSLAGSIVSFDHPGTCAVVANQPGNAIYSFASLQQVFTVAKGAQSLSFTSVKPVSPLVGGAPYTPTAVSSRLLPVALGVDGASAVVCVMDPVTSAVTFIGVGDCHIVAHQLGSVDYLAAPLLEQVVTVVPGVQLVSFVGTPPTGARVGESLFPSARSSANLTVTFSTNSSVCGVDSTGAVVFLSVGTCDLYGVQLGTSDFAASNVIHTTITILKGFQAITFAVTAPTDAVVAGAPLVLAATSSSGLAITYTVDPTSAAVCNVSAVGVVSFLGPGTCAVDATQAGTADYNPVTRRLSFTVGQNYNNACAELPASGCGCAGPLCTFVGNLVAGTSLAVSGNSSLVVEGDLQLTSSSTLTVYASPRIAGAFVRVRGRCTFAGTLKLIVGRGSSAASRRRTDESVQVVDAQQTSGQFSAVTVTSSDPCTSVTSSDATYSGTGMSVLVQTTDSCAPPSTGLSGGAIAGIAVGCVALAAIIVVAIVLLQRRARRRRDMQRNVMLQAEEMEQLQHASAQFKSRQLPAMSL
jgi:hypothetical protein